MKRRMFTKAQLLTLAAYTAKDLSDNKVAVQTADGDQAFDLAVKRRGELEAQAAVIDHNLAVEDAGPTPRAGKTTAGGAGKTKGPKKPRQTRAEKAALKAQQAAGSETSPPPAQT